MIRTPQWEYVVTDWTERGVATSESFSLCGVVAPESREYRTVIIDGFIRNTSQELIKIDSLRNYGSDLWPMIENRSGLTIGQGRFVRYVQLGGLLTSPYLKNGAEVTEGSYGEPTAEYLPPGYGIPVGVIGEYCALVKDYGLTIRQTDAFVPAGHVMRDPDMLNPNIPVAANSTTQEVIGWGGDLKYVFSNPTIVSLEASGRQEQELQIAVTNQSSGVNVVGIATQVLVYLDDGRVVSGDFEFARNPQAIPPGSTTTLRYLLTASGPTTRGNHELYGLADFEDAVVVLSVSTESRAWRLQDTTPPPAVAPAPSGQREIVNLDYGLYLYKNVGYEDLLSAESIGWLRAIARDQRNVDRLVAFIQDSERLASQDPGGSEVMTGLNSAASLFIGNCATSAQAREYMRLMASLVYSRFPDRWQNFRSYTLDCGLFAYD